MSLAKLATFSFIAIPTLAAVISRSAPPADWFTEGLEPYDTYHSRYQALDCHAKHDTDFFDQCCHPLLRDESLSSRQWHCNPSLQHATSTPDDTVEDCDEDEKPVHRKRDITSITPALALIAPQGEATTTESSSAKTSKTVYSGGFATYYYQHGIAGACGKVHKDTDMIAAIDGDRYGNLGAISSLCGKSVRLTNTKNNKSVTVVIADACPTCTNGNSIDLSESAFKEIATTREGIVPITWSFV
ncbi:expansin family protein [Coprinopsis sp. MPI-PUGE-AT-0042]|nr:expansin family protein [Coprinopsis sp. MPI-PUGE-AT-0042]